MTYHKKKKLAIIAAAIVLAVILGVALAMGRANEETGGGKIVPYIFQDVAKVDEVISPRSVVVEIVKPDEMQASYGAELILEAGDKVRFDCEFEQAALVSARAGDEVVVSRGNGAGADTSGETMAIRSNGIELATAPADTLSEMPEVNVLLEKYDLGMSSSPGLPFTVDLASEDCDIVVTAEKGRLVEWEPPMGIVTDLGSTVKASKGKKLYWQPLLDGEEINSDTIAVQAVDGNGVVKGERAIYITRDEDFYYSARLGE